MIRKQSVFILVLKKKRKKIENYLNYLMKKVSFKFKFNYFIAFTSNKIINEINKEEDEEKNNNKKKNKNDNNDNNSIFMDKDIKDKQLQLKEINNIPNIDNEKNYLKDNELIIDIDNNDLKDNDSNIDNEKNILKINKDNIMDSINNRLEKGKNILIKNKLDLKKNKHNKHLLINSNWNHSSNYKLNTFNNENVLYKRKFIKNSPIKDSIIKENKVKGIILPEIKTPCLKRDNINLNNNNNFYYFTKISKESLINNNINNEQKNEITTDKTSFFRNIKLNKLININNNDTQTTQSVTISTKNQTNSKNNIIPNINEDGNKYEMGLIPTGSTPNNNIIIPKLNLKRPFSNRKKLSENLIEKENIKNEKLEYNNEIINCHISQNSRNKICKRKESKEKINISMKNKELFILLSGIQKIIPNFHKIKIEKGMINNNNKNIHPYSKKISYDYKNKNNINFNDNN